MDDYIPLSGLNNYDNPHVPLPPRADPWYVWAIALSALPTFAVLVLFAGSTGVLPAVALLATVLASAWACVLLARKDQAAIAQLGETQETSPWLAAVPLAYLLIRAFRRAASNHRGNPLAPVLLNVATGFALGYFLVLFLMAIVSYVNYAQA